MKKFILTAGILALVAGIYSCKKDKPGSGETHTVSLDLPATTDVYYSGKKIIVPGQNEKATLGRVLFYDSHLSLNNAVSCASCHKQTAGFADDVAFSRGFENKLTGRNSMPIANLTFFNGKVSLSQVSDNKMMGGQALFWDGRETNLQNLVARPLTNHIEMGIEDVSAIANKLAGLPYYKELFNKAYGSEEITFDKISESIAFFITSIKAANTKYDRYVNHKENLTAMEMEGLNLFHTKYNCGQCHRVDTAGYEGNSFIDIGLPVNNDRGRGGLTGKQADNNLFRVPNLRNIALSAPYMHDGRFGTLDEVLDHYSKGIDSTPNLSWILRDQKGSPIRMNISDNDKKAIAAFLNTLTDYTMVTDKKFSNPFVVK
jgi:cytochrome c peroxidase